METNIVALHSKCDCSAVLKEILGFTYRDNRVPIQFAKKIRNACALRACNEYHLAAFQAVNLISSLDDDLPPVVELSSNGDVQNFTKWVLSKDADGERT